jgi:hypothetical protein
MTVFFQMAARDARALAEALKAVPAKGDPDRQAAETVTARRDANRLTLSFKRDDVCVLLDALEAVIEDFKYDGGLVLAEDYIRLQNRLRARLRSHDSTPFRAGAAA